MRRPFRLVATAALTLGLLGGDIAKLSFAPAVAEARWHDGYGVHYDYPYSYRRGYPYGHGYAYRRYNRVDAGDVIATVAIIAGVAAIATAASQANRDRGNDGWGDRGWDRPRDRGSGDRREDAAIDQCRTEAERQARTYGTSASLRDIFDVDSRGNAVRIRGLVEVARSEIVPGGTERRLTSERFTCIVRAGYVESYQLGGSDVASRW